MGGGGGERDMIPIAVTSVTTRELASASGW